jgi:hypothetical protein
VTLFELEDEDEREWREIPGFALYAVSRDGLVQRTVGGSGAQKGLVLKKQSQKGGYVRAYLCKTGRTQDDPISPRMIHRLVWEAFVGPIPAGMQINHINGIKTDNRLENLEVVTPKENIWHGIRTGLIKRRGVDNPRAKLSEQDVWDVLRMLASGLYPTAISRKYGVAATTIRYIQTGQNWSWLTMLNKESQNGTQQTFGF